MNDATLHPRRTAIAQQWVAILSLMAFACLASLAIGWWERAHLAAVADLPNWFAILGIVAIGVLMLRAGRRSTVAALGLRHAVTHPPRWLALLGGLSVAIYLVAYNEALNHDFGADRVKGTLTDVASVLAATAIAPLIISLVWTLISRPREATLKPPRFAAPLTTEKLLHWYKRDAPVDRAEDDLFEYDQIAYRISTRLVDPETPSQALLGALGSGKTTIRNLVKQRFDAGWTGQRIKFVAAELWPYETPRAAVEGILRAVIDTLGEEVGTLALRGVPKEYGDAIESASGLGAAVARFFHGPSDPFETFRRIDAVATAIGVRFVLWVEDLERFASGDPASSTLSADELERLAPIRALLYGLDQLPSMTVVTATTTLFQRFDLEKIARFVEKIPDLPRADARRLVASIRRHWLASTPPLIDPATRLSRDAVGWEVDPDKILLWFGLTPNSLADSVLTLAVTPRVLKQVLRRTEEVWTTLKGEVDLDDVLAMNAIREAVPSAFAIIEQSVPDLRGGKLRRNKEASPLDELEQRLKGLGLDERTTQAVVFVVHELFGKQPRPQGLGMNRHTDYWARYLSALPVKESVKDQPVLRVLDEGNVRSIAEAFSDPTRAGAAEDFVSMIAGPLVVEVLETVLEMRNTEAPAAWPIDDFGGRRPPGLIPLWRVLRGQSDYDDNALFDVLTTAVDRSISTNLPLVTEIEHWFATRSEVSDVFPPDLHKALQAHIRTRLRERYTNAPDALAKNLAGTPPPTLLWLCWGLERVRSDAIRGVPFEPWEPFGKTLLQAAERASGTMLQQLAPLITRDVRSRDGERTTNFDNEQCTALFGSVADVKRLYAQATEEERKDVRVAAIATTQAQTGAQPLSGQPAALDTQRAVNAISNESNETSDQSKVPGMIEGFWFNDPKEVPAQRPEYNPTGALLPEEEGLMDGASCLDLVLHRNTWLPLSEAGLLTYSHSTHFANAEPSYFVPAAQWGVLYKVELRDKIPKRDIAKRFGKEASSRARDDQPTVVLEVSKA